MIQVIIFDFGGVILQHRTDIIPFILKQLFPKEFDKVHTIWEEKKILLNTGKLSSLEFLTTLKTVTHSNRSLEELMTMWKDLYKKEAQGINWQLLDLIGKLKKNYKVYLFTDTIDVHDEINKTRGLYEKFDAVYKSFEEGISKQEGDDAFLYVINKIHAISEGCLFIDDLPSNVDTAIHVGLKGIVYKNNDQLLSDLRSFEIHI